MNARTHLLNLQRKQVQLAEMVRVYDHVVAFHIRNAVPLRYGTRDRDNREMVALCDMLYEIHSKLHQVEEAIRVAQQDVYSEACEESDFEYDGLLGEREYDV